MAYDPKKDVKVAEFEVGELLVTVQKYNGGEPKVQVSRSFKNKADETQYGRAGRLSKEEFNGFCDLKEKILEAMEGKKDASATKKRKGGKDS